MSFEACAAIVERADPERFRAAMAVPLPARRVLLPIYALLAEVAKAPWVTQEAMIAEMRLQWWRDVLEEIATGAQVRRHEVATPLAEVLTPDATQLLDRAVAARRWDIYRDPHEDLRGYLVDTTSVPMQAAALAMGRTGPSDDLGYAVGLARYADAAAALKAQGRAPWPVAFDVEAEANAAKAALKGKGPEVVEAYLARPRLAALAKGQVREVSPLRGSLHLVRCVWFGP